MYLIRQLPNSTDSRRSAVFSSNRLCNHFNRGKCTRQCCYFLLMPTHCLISLESFVFMLKIKSLLTKLCHDKVKLWLTFLIQWNSSCVHTPAMMPILRLLIWNHSLRSIHYKQCSIFCYSGHSRWCYECNKMPTAQCSFLHTNTARLSAGLAQIKSTHVKCNVTLNVMNVPMTQ